MNSRQGRSLFSGSIHTSPDIFESETLPSGFKNFHVHTNSSGPHFVPPYWSVRDWKRFRSTFRFFPTLESGLKNFPDSLPKSLDTCGRKWFRKKKLRIQIYPDTVDGASGFSEFKNKIYGKQPNISFVISFFSWCLYPNKEIYAGSSRLEILFVWADCQEGKLGKNFCRMLQTSSFL